MALTNEEVRWAREQLVNAMEGESCVNNYRYCDADDEEDVERYMEEMKSGCCLYFDDGARHPVTRTYIWFGCNFGH